MTQANSIVAVDDSIVTSRVGAPQDDCTDSYQYVFVVRHGERLDYVMRDKEKKNWCYENADKPWDPPLTTHGTEQATILGKHIRNLINSGKDNEAESLFHLPPVTAIYSSPFLRCRQTSFYLRKGLMVDNEPQYDFCQIRYEWGLAESLNEMWYRSWSLPGADGTWGFKINGSKEFDVESLHPAAKVPIQQSVLQTIQQDIIESNTNEGNGGIDNTYKSITNITSPYCFATNCIESRNEQRQRMLHALETIASSKSGTIILVSHGGPVTHLYEALTSNPWHVHGESTYCCYSIYRRKSSEASKGPWEPVRVNESKYLHETNMQTINYMD